MEPHLVVRDERLGLAVRQRLALHAGHNAVHAVVDLAQRDALAVAAARQDGRLVQQVRQVRACTGGAVSPIGQQRLHSESFVSNMSVAACAPRCNQRTNVCE